MTSLPNQKNPPHCTTEPTSQRIKIQQLEQALFDLQTKIAFMDDTIETLNQMVSQQTQTIQDQQRLLQLLYQKITDLPTHQIQPFDILQDKPPHY